MTRTGFIAIVGKPNVGKSTLLNALLGEKIAIVSKKPQTTRTRITGILTEGEDQYVFLDTPGTHVPKTKLGEAMMRAVNETVSPGSCDAALLVVDASDRPKSIEIGIAEKLKKSKIPAILVINKTDTVNAERIGEAILEYSSLCDFVSVVPISAMKNDGVDIIKKECASFLYESPWYFSEDDITDQPERQIAAEIIREKLLRVLDDEIPHGTAVVIEDFREGGKCLRIRAEIFCERESHKRIIIGKNGSMLKTIGTYAREDMEEFFGIKVFLDLWVKVKENWRDSNFNISNFGLSNKDL
ncbi:MAG: GTPase Era [Ruminococcaceae bacterium]|nr:GTPase Era [Oscillospiraceae bacterium]